MLDKTRAALKRVRGGVARASKSVASCFVAHQDEPRKKLEIRVVHETTLKRKGSLENLRGGYPSDSEVNQRSHTITRPVHELRTGSWERADLLTSINSTANCSASASIDQESDHGLVNEECHAIEHVPDEEMAQVLQQTRSIDVSRSGARPRPKGLVIDAGVPVDEDALQSAVSPTNTKAHFQTPRSPTSWPVKDQNEEGCGSPSMEDFRWPFDMPIEGGLVNSDIDWDKRFDSMVDTMQDDNTRSCSLHSVLGTDIALLVVEVQILNDRLAMARMRDAYRRMSTLGPEYRPRSWPVGQHSVRSMCTCRRPTKAYVEKATMLKRHTWHAGESQSARSRSKESETREQVIERHAAGTNLFRRSLYGLLDGDSGRPPVKDDEQAPPRVHVDKSFDFRRECERVARRIRPTFAVSRS